MTEFRRLSEDRLSQDEAERVVVAVPNGPLLDLSLDQALALARRLTAQADEVIMARSRPSCGPSRTTRC